MFCYLDRYTMIYTLRTSYRNKKWTMYIYIISYPLSLAALMSIQNPVIKWTIYFFPRGSHVSAFPKAHQEGLAGECELEHHCQFGWGNGVIRVQMKYIYLNIYLSCDPCDLSGGMDLPFDGSNLTKKLIIYIYIYLLYPKHAMPSLSTIIAQSWLANTIEVGCFCPKGRTPPATLGGGVWDLPIDGRNTAPANGWWLSRYPMAECASFDTSVVGCRIFEPSTVYPANGWCSNMIIHFLFWALRWSIFSDVRNVDENMRLPPKLH